MLNVRVAAAPDALFRMAADELARIATGAASERGVCYIALSGGSTPRALYALLATPLYRDSIPWTRTHFFWSDERQVPPDSSQSNYGMAREVLLRHVPVPASNVHRICGELSDASSAAAQYEDALRQTLKPVAGQLPRFDAILLGMGEDGHTASLFPGSAAIGEASQWVVAPFVEKFRAYRVTFTLPLINEAANVLFLVTGKAKATILERVLNGNESAQVLPCRGVHPREGRLIWFVDRAAASRLPKELQEGCS